MKTALSAFFSHVFLLFIFLLVSISAAAQQGTFTVSAENTGLVTFRWTNVVGYPTFDRRNTNGTWTRVASGPSPSSPSGQVSIYQANGTYTYRMTPCTVTQNSGMCIPQQATQTITVAAPAPTLSVSFEPAVITAGQTSRLQWTSTNARSCFAPNRSAGLSALYVNGTSGSVQFRAPDVVTTAQEEWINVVCDSWAGGAVSKRVTLTISRGTTSSSAASSSSTGYFDTDNG